MIIELNINLNVIGRRNSLDDCDARDAHSRQFIREHFVEADYNRLKEGHRDLLVARIDASNTTMERAERLVGELSAQLQQHCIACYFPNYQRRLSVGVLVGPKANEWTDFSIHAFTRYRHDAVVI